MIFLMLKVFFVGTGDGGRRNRDRVTIRKPSSASISIPSYSSPLHDEIFVEEKDGEGGEPVVYCSCGKLIFYFGGT